MKKFTFKNKFFFKRVNSVLRLSRFTYLQPCVKLLMSCVINDSHSDSPSAKGLENYNCAAKQRKTRYFYNRVLFLTKHEAIAIFVFFHPLRSLLIFVFSLFSFHIFLGR